MALTHVTAIRNSLADLVVDAIDAGATDASGDIQVATSSAFTTVLATILFSAPPAFGAASGGTATMNGAPKEDSNAAGGGTAANFRTRDRDNNEVFRGTVATSGADMNLSSTTINAGDAVRINSFTYSSSP